MLNLITRIPRPALHISHQLTTSPASEMRNQITFAYLPSPIHLHLSFPREQAVFNNVQLTKKSQSKPYGFSIIKDRLLITAFLHNHLSYRSFSCDAIICDLSRENVPNG